jgi:hypothetical protein
MPGVWFAVAHTSPNIIDLDGISFIEWRTTEHLSERIEHA